MTIPAGGRVLISDHSAFVRAVLRSALERAGYWVEEAQDSVSALKLLDAGDHDLLVTDFEAPRRSGFNLLKAARQAGAAVVVLGGSGMSAADLHTRAVALGADVYIDKSSGVAGDVVLAVKQILDRASSSRRIRSSDGAVPRAAM